MHDMFLFVEIPFHSERLANTLSYLPCIYVEKYTIRIFLQTEIHKYTMRILQGHMSAVGSKSGYASGNFHKWEFCEWHIHLPKRIQALTSLVPNLKIKITILNANVHHKQNSNSTSLTTNSEYTPLSHIMSNNTTITGCIHSIIHRMDQWVQWFTQESSVCWYCKSCKYRTSFCQGINQREEAS